MRQLDLFSALQSSTEGIDTEFKSARGGMPGSFWESYSAMANTQGGSIVLGVAEKPTGLVWEGVPDAAQLRTVLWGQLNDRHKVSTNLLRDDDVRTVEDEGRQFVVVNVPRASRLQRPVFVGLNPMTGTYRRADEGDYRCSDDEVRRMLADQSDTPTDSQIVEHFGQPDFDPETVKQYRNRFASRAPDHPWLLLDDAPLLTKLSALRRDRATGLEGATVAGLLMFGRFEALCDALPGFHVDSPQSSPQLGGDSPQLPPNSPQLDRLAGLSPEIQGLLPIAEPARKNKKLPVDELKGIIQKLCDGRWLATSELAALVDRDADKLQSRFLTAMVREGVLELRYPDVRNRPDQAYRTVARVN
jgi:hypothetical protein